MTDERDAEGNRLASRARRYAKVTSAVGGMALREAGRRLTGGEADYARIAAEMRRVLGGLKGPLMKVAQIIATVPDAVPEEFAKELATLQSQAPAMGWPFVRRRMSAELGPDWRGRFADFAQEAVGAASLGQVHRATAHDGTALAIKLQYPDMLSAVEADLKQLKLALSIHKRMDGVIDTAEIYEEISDRLREELDYIREAAHMRLYAEVLGGESHIRVPRPLAELSTRRLLSMTWLEGTPILDWKGAGEDQRNHLAEVLFRAWWLPFARLGVIHGDPHLGNYTVLGDAEGINLLDYGCVRIFPASFVGGVVELYHALRTGDRDRAVHAYETWGFRALSAELIETLNIWARFIYGPLLDDRERTIADGVSPAEYGRREMMEVHGRLKALGPLRPPREFVFMDRAAIGLGAVFLHLGATRNWYRLFNEALEGFDAELLAGRQRAALDRAGIPAS
ncbi:ABC1 kinase family protein [Zavarzinia sp.]|uniref:ABC1 kinase family protein n=1 Tax=Zavarzinia sp. TaxID=2027920 RepID=UPI003BB5FE54